MPPRRTLTTQDLANLKLDKHGRYCIGSKIGDGAQGSVFRVYDTDTGEDGWWAAKVTPHPKTTKNKRSSHEANSRHLSHERLLYQVNLVQLQGTVIPRVPSANNKSLQAFKTDEAGFDYLIMEQMQQELFPALLADPPISRNTCVLGPLCQRMLGMLQEIHQVGFVVTDIKAENFMVAHGEGSIVQRLRLVDLGLFKSYRLGGKHVDNDGLPGFRGTPKYASLNTHELETPSRRDDVEAIVYLFMETVIVAHAHFTGQTERYQRDNSFLPWSLAQSDDDLGAQKQAQVSNTDSELYARMPPAAARTLKQCWDEVRSYKYKTTPNYDKLSGLLSTLSVPTAATKKRGTKRASTTPQSPARRTTRRSSNETPRRHAKAKNYPSDEKDLDEMDIDEVWGEEEGGEEEEEEENLKPAANKTCEKLRTNRNYQAATLVAIHGPYKGSKWVIQEGDENLIFGQNPSNRAGHKLIKLVKDASVDKGNHARISLQLYARKLRLDVWDCKSKTGTLINEARVTTNGHAAFDGNVIKMGQTWLQVCRAPAPNGQA